MLGGLLARSFDRRQFSVDTLQAREITLVDQAGHKRAEFKADQGRTYLVFFDRSDRPRVTLNLDEGGASEILQGVEAADKIALSVNDALQTASIYTGALTSAVNIVGREEARVKLSDSLFTDARSASVSIGPRVTKLRLSSNGAESDLWAENEPSRTKAANPLEAELAMRASQVSHALLRVSTEDKPAFELGNMNRETCTCPLVPSLLGGSQ